MPDALKGADTLILATDPDREGEAISWHVLEVLNEKKALKGQKVERVVFNAITKQSVTEAMKHPREIDTALVDAYLARRALDYLVGFTLSPVLWRKLPGARSAGRVQSVALRLVCDRELEIEKFVAKEYWSIVAKLQTPRDDSFEARLVGADGQKIQRLDIGSGAQAEDFKRDLEGATFTVAVGRGQARAAQSAAALHHLDHAAGSVAASSALRPAIAMRLAQRLYEGVEIDGETTGLITYMRTDGIDIAPEAIADIRAMIGKNYGKQYVPGSPRAYQNKSKNAQEAHEAVRPTDPGAHAGRGRQICRPRPGAALRIDLESRGREPDGIRRARAHHRRYRRQSRRAHDRPARHRPGGEVRRLPRRSTRKARTKPPRTTSRAACRRCRRARRSPSRRSNAAQHFTEPPPRFSEAALVKRMEELGIGRPSTYASILQVLQDRGYVRIDKKRLIPEDKGRVVVGFLESFFQRYVEYDFTADLEEKLDEISNDEIDWQRGAAAISGSTSSARSTRSRKCASRDVLDALNELLEPHIFPARADGGDARQCPQCGTGQAVAEDSDASAPSSAARTIRNAASPGR